MLQIFSSPSQNDNQKNQKSKNESQNNQSLDYQILMGDNGFSPCTSQQSLCQNQRITSENSSVDHNDNYISCPHIFYLVIFLTIYVLLILLGASVFSIFEQRVEHQMRDRILRIQQTFLARHPCVGADSLDEFIDSVIDALDDGINLSQLNKMLKEKKDNVKSDISSDIPVIHITNNIRKDDEKQKYEKYSIVSKREANQEIRPKSSQTKSVDNEDNNMIASAAPMDQSNWEFSSSLLFVTSIVTTVGYGHVTPVTFEGKIFCIVFSCVAIPYTLLFLSTLVSILQYGPIKLLENWMTKLVLKYFSLSFLLIRFLHLVMVTVILMFLILILPALLFTYIENNWTFLDSLYYCYISVTTVGLGDFVPATAYPSHYANIHIYRIGVVIYLYCGLALIMLWIALILRIPQFNFKTFLVTEKHEIGEHSHIIDYNKGIDYKNYGTDFSTHK